MTKGVAKPKNINKHHKCSIVRIPPPLEIKRIEVSIGPTQGVHPKLKVKPSKNAPQILSSSFPLYPQVLFFLKMVFLQFPFE